VEEGDPTNGSLFLPLTLDFRGRFLSVTGACYRHNPRHDKGGVFHIIPWLRQSGVSAEVARERKNLEARLAERIARDQKAGAALDGAPRRIATRGQSACFCRATRVLIWALMRCSPCFFALLAAVACAASAAPGDLKWKIDVGGGVASAPTLSPNGDILAASHDGHLYAITPEGEIRWSFPRGAIWTAPMVGPDGTIYFGADKLYALNAEGVEQWSFSDTEGTPWDWHHIGQTTIGPDGAIYFIRAQAPNLYCLSPDGTLRWKIPGPFTTAPVVTLDGSLVMPMGYGEVVSINPDGAVRWLRDVGESIYSPPALGSNGTIYVGVSGSDGASGAMLSAPPALCCGATERAECSAPPRR
jgi:hypothetical protein